MKHLACLIGCTLTATALAGTYEGRIVDAHGPLQGVRVYPDRGPRVAATPLPWALTDKDGRFQLKTIEEDKTLVVEKSGYFRDFVSTETLKESIVMVPALEHRVERALFVRLDFPDQKSGTSDEALRTLLFSRQPGAASAANYLYEVSKGSLELEEGAMLRLEDDTHPSPRRDEHRDALSEWVLKELRDTDLRDFDRVDNRTGALHPDGKPDHLWIVAPGAARNVTLNPDHLSASSFLLPLPWERTHRWGVLFFAEETPLGNIVHELFHGMGEHRVDDLYLDCDHPMTAGIWDLMDAGQYRGWDAGTGPWQQRLGYSPSHPMGWVRAELWYRGRFRDTVSTRIVKGTFWTGWIAPLAKAPGVDPQRVLIPDPRAKGRFWELNVRRPLGFDQGRVGGRWGPGYEGLVVAHVDPSRLSEDEPLGAVHIVDAHPDTTEPAAPRFPCGRWQLDDAAFSLGVGGQPHGSDGPLSWDVLEEDASGRMKVTLRLHTQKSRKKP